MRHNPRAVHDATDLERIFADCFSASHRTVLVGGGDEPLYTPATDDAPATILYREDFFASALHEMAHWCVAGAHRRTLVDWGYWYAPDGRTPEQQAAFERVEVLPQALEWIFADACGWRFQLSADNVESGMGPSEAFACAVRARRDSLLAEGLDGRARKLEAALAASYRTRP